jgi:hypothetical protein
MNKASENPNEAMSHRSFRLTLFDSRVKPHLRTVEWSLNSCRIACAVLAVVGVCLVAEALPEGIIKKVVYSSGIPAAYGAFLLSNKWLIRLYVARGSMTSEEAQDFPGLVGRTGDYAESWLLPLDDDTASKPLA